MIPTFKLQACFPSMLRNEKVRNQQISALKRQNKDKTEWRPPASVKFCFILSADSTYGYVLMIVLNCFNQENNTYKGKIKETYVNDDNYVVSVPVFTTWWQPRVTCSTGYNWSASPLASFDQSYFKN